LWQGYTVKPTLFCQIRGTAVKAAKDWYYSEAYQSVAKHRQRGAIYQGLIVEGIA
jgi:uncharacterized protein (DUF1330 family)